MKLQREDIHPLQDTCPYFMWHVCNALALYLLMRGLLANRSK